MYILTLGGGARGPGARYVSTDVCERRRDVCCPVQIARAKRRVRKRACGPSEAAGRRPHDISYGMIIRSTIEECEGPEHPAQ